jgi:siroheme synthase
MAADTVALYMAAGQAAEIAATLIRAGRSPETPGVLVENASLEGERRVPTTLRRLRDDPPQAFEGPVLLAIGEVFRDACAALEIRQTAPTLFDVHRKAV